MVDLRVNAAGELFAVETAKDVESTRVPADRKLAPNTWHSLRLDVDWDASGATVSMRLGHEQVIIGAPLTLPPGADSPVVALGLRTRSAGVWRAQMDNVTIEAP